MLCYVMFIINLRAQPMPTKMMMRQTARPTNKTDTISRTTTKITAVGLARERTPKMLH